MTTSRLYALSLVLILTCTGCTGVRSSPDLITVSLPKPTGYHPVGRATFHLRYRDTAEWDQPTQRDTMVSVFYPAKPTGAAHQASWMPKSIESRISEDLHKSGGVKPDLWQLSPLAATSRPPAAEIKQKQLLVVSPGYGMVRGLYTGLSQELASRGYPVVVIDHPGDSAAITYPNGQTKSLVPIDEDDKSAVSERLEHRERDVSKTLDWLYHAHTSARLSDADGRRLPSGLAALLNTNHVTGIGHSLGGPTLVQAMAHDHRLKSVINMDGSFVANSADTPDGRVLLVASDGHTPAHDSSWRKWCSPHREPAKAVSLPGSAHASFTDLVSIFDDLRSHGAIGSADAINTVGTIPPASLQRDQVRLYVNWLEHPATTTENVTQKPFIDLAGCTD